MSSSVTMENSISVGDDRHASARTALRAQASAAGRVPTMANGPNSRLAVIGTQGRQLISWIG
jgi:hypothetical protein